VSPRLKKIVTAVVTLAVIIGLFLIPGGKKADFSVANEFVLKPIVKIPKLGPIDLSITKAVVYLWISVALIVVLAVIATRLLKHTPGRFQTILEGLYQIASDGIVGSVMRTGGMEYFPYIASIFFFILITNFMGLAPLPFGEHGQLVFYAATSNINVTLALALCTFLLTHYAGVRKRGTMGYLKHWVIPGAPPVMKQFVYVLDIISEFNRLISLTVRLFANMLGGHAILAVFFAMALIFQNYLAAAVLQGGSLVFFLFEIFVSVIQAFIFAILSAVYVSGAIEEEE
jgi:F-type H+-transporting ATPase subunit a